MTVHRLIKILKASKAKKVVAYSMKEGDYIEPKIEVKDDIIYIGEWGEEGNEN